MAPSTSFPERLTESEQRAVLQQHARNAQSTLKTGCAVVMAVPVIAWGIVAIFLPFWASVLYVAVTALLGIGVWLTMQHFVRASVVIDPSKWSPAEVILIRRYYHNLEYPSACQSYSAGLRFVAIVGVPWAGWLFYCGHWGTAMLMLANTVTQLWLSWRLDPTAFGLSKSTTDLIGIQQIIQNRQPGGTSREEIADLSETHDPAGVAQVIALLEKRAGRDDADAMYHLAEALMTGNGVPKDENRAVALYRRSIESSDKSAAYVSEAMYNLAQMCLNGQGTRQDYAEARKWFLKAAELGVTDAMLMVGRLHDTGRGVPEDALEAFKWYEKAAMLGNANGMVAVGTAFGIGRGVAQDGQKAVRWSKQAAELGDPRGVFNFGVIYLKGEWVDQDVEEAIVWLRKSADMGFQDAVTLLAEIGAAR
jgi:TPR repeat protein